jgi:signal transduction histidine kinase
MDLNTLDKSQLIEEIKHLQAQLEEQQSAQYSHEFFASFIEHIPIPVAILKVSQHNQSSRYTYQFVNTALAKLNNKSINQHLGQTLEDVIENDAIAINVHANFEAVVKTQATSIREIDLPIEGSNTRLIEYHFPIMQNNKVIAVGAALVDITKLNQALTEAKTANKAKSAFLSQVSHEIRTPMNTMMGFAQLLAMQSKQSEFSDKQMQCLHHIQNSGEQLLHIIDDLLDLSSIEAGKISVDIQDVNLSNLVQDAVNSMKHMAKSRDINIIFQDKSQFLHVVRADKMRLSQVLLNLLSNAIKYNKIAGTVTLFSQLLPHEKLRISVQDNGFGMSETQQNDVFKPFERLDQENGPIPGSGIGLLICKQIMHALNGDIHFESEQRHGSRFWIDIPISNTEPTLTGYSHK